MHPSVPERPVVETRTLGSYPQQPPPAFFESIDCLAHKRSVSGIEKERIIVGYPLLTVEIRDSKDALTFSGDPQCTFAVNFQSPHRLGEGIRKPVECIGSECRGTVGIHYHTLAIRPYPYNILVPVLEQGEDPAPDIKP